MSVSDDLRPNQENPFGRIDKNDTRGWTKDRVVRISRGHSAESNSRLAWASHTKQQPSQAVPAKCWLRFWPQIAQSSRTERAA